MKQRDRLRMAAPLLVEAMEAVEKDHRWDIVERLGNFHIGTTIDDLVGDAKAEIERLRAEIERLPRTQHLPRRVMDIVERLHKGCEGCEGLVDGYCPICSEGAAEIERLRAELYRYANANMGLLAELKQLSHKKDDRDELDEAEKQRLGKLNKGEGSDG